MNRSSRIKLAALFLIASCYLFVQAEDVESRIGSAGHQDDLARLESRFNDSIRQILNQYCIDCHSGTQAEGEVDLSVYSKLAEIKADLETWERIRSMLSSAQMPPIDASQPSDSEREELTNWVKDFLSEEAKSTAGDPGPVVLRRLSNAEYTYSLRDLTGIERLNPTSQFPVDGAAGEGFTNAGSGLVMSPALLTKYLDAAKEVADHAVFLPDGMRFSDYSTRRDWTDEGLASIREFYRQYTDESGDGIPIRRYFLALDTSRTELRSNELSLTELAQRQQLNSTYLSKLWETLDSPEVEGSFVQNTLKQLWNREDRQSIEPIVQLVEQWQDSLWRFNTIGHIGRDGGPTVWQERVDPIATQHDFNIPIDTTTDEDRLAISFDILNLREGVDQSVVRWQNPRFVAEGKPDLPLAKIESIQTLHLQEKRTALEKTDRYLNLVDEVGEYDTAPSIDELASQHGLDPGVLAAWFEILKVRASRPVVVRGHFTEQMTQAAGYDFVRGWGTDQTPSVVANSSEQQVRIPGIAPPKSILVHPSPTLFVAVGWQSPVDGEIDVQASLHDAHPECGNGVEWRLVHQTSSDSISLWEGAIDIAGKDAMEPQKISIRKGDLLAFEIGPRESSHACDLTQIGLTIKEVGGENRTWTLAEDVSPNILAANPHPDGYGNDAVWHFYRGEMSTWAKLSADSLRVPTGSLLARWQDADSSETRRALAGEIQELAIDLESTEADDESNPDRRLRVVLRKIADSVDVDRIIARASNDTRFGVLPSGAATDENDLVVSKCESVEIGIPLALVQGRSLVVSGRLDDDLGTNGIVQLSVGPSQNLESRLRADLPVVINANDSQRHIVEAGYKSFGSLFPAAICYSRIVPVDEVVTLTLYFREDHHLKRLFLNSSEQQELDRLWDELLFISQQPLAQVVALEQIIQFATQDRPDLVIAFEPLKSPVQEKANQFRRRLKSVEPVHLNAILAWARNAWRRPLSESESSALIHLYRTLREDGQEHEPALRLVLARVMTSPNFLYRREQPAAEGTQGPISGWEQATRLSYFLWSSLPDSALQKDAEEGQLLDRDVLSSHASRMLRDERIRRLAIEFACQWLHLKDFDVNDDKNESLYPEFGTQRVVMYEETILFFEDMFRNNGSILDVIDSDQTFLNEGLANHYGIPNVVGSHWRKVNNLSEFERGGILGMGTFLASQSGASRTSPILRGNWISETLLGERLPKPPADVPVLPDSVPEGLTTRQLIEKHRADAACAKCHDRIDPYGVALEQFDAIGRRRESQADTKTLLLDGHEIDGIEELKEYLVTFRREDFVRQFCRKMLGFALGRSVQLSDEPLIEEMLTRLKEDDFRVHTAIMTIIASPQFREVRSVNWTQP